MLPSGKISQQSITVKTLQRFARWGKCPRHTYSSVSSSYNKKLIFPSSNHEYFAIHNVLLQMYFPFHVTKICQILRVLKQLFAKQTMGTSSCERECKWSLTATAVWGVCNLLGGWWQVPGHLPLCYSWERSPSLRLCEERAGAQQLYKSQASWGW